MALHQHIAHDLLSGTCGLVRFEREPGDDELPLPKYEVLGTAFMIRDDCIATATHVFNTLPRRPDGQVDCVLLFVHGARSGLEIGFGKLDDAAHAFVDDSDIVLCKFTFVARQPPQALRPLVPVERLDLQLGEDVAACGYLLGATFLEGIEFGYDRRRYGPLILQGHVAAISPYSGSNPSRFLTDMRVGRGMSGAPIVRRDCGKVIGVHSGGELGTTGRIGIAAPLDQSTLNLTLQAIDRAPAPSDVPQARAPG